MARVLIAGCGYVGAALGAELDRDSHTVWGLRRKAASLPWGVRPVEADLAIPSSLDELPKDLDHVFYMAAPGGRDDALYRTTYVEGLRNLLDALRKQGQKPKRVFFVSSTSVYAQSAAEWVDETSPAEAPGFAGRRLREAEQILWDSSFPGTVVRLAGIYGPRRSRLVERVRTGSATYREGRFTNRIHRDDAAGALKHLMGLARPESLYLGVDCEPVGEGALLQWLAGVLGAPEPRSSPEREGLGKRCRNERLLGTGYVFRYPTFREGYAAVLAELS